KRELLHDLASLHRVEEGLPLDLARGERKRALNRRLAFEAVELRANPFAVGWRVHFGRGRCLRFYLALADKECDHFVHVADGITDVGFEEDGKLAARERIAVLAAPLP